MSGKRAALAAACVGLLVVPMLLSAAEPTPAEWLTKADQAFEAKNYRDAAEAYAAFLKAAPKHEKWRHASERIITARLRLQLFDEALAAAEAYIARSKDTPYEARAERLTGNLYMLLPHWGTRAGGVFHRAKYQQGLYVSSTSYDKRLAVQHLERARDLYAQYDQPGADLSALPEAERADWRNERIECNFDLAGACARFGIYENNYFYWYRYWAQRDDELAETAGETDFDEQTGYWQWTRKRPIGLRLDPDGRPMFPTTPRAYAKDLNDDQKILFILKEARDLDRTAGKKYAGLSYYRQAMLARSRFGMDRLNSYASLYYSGGYPLQEEMKQFNPWEMKDKEALVLAGGRITVVDLPRDWDVLGLLRLVAGDYGQSGVADEAQYGVGLYYQSRQQYTTALDEYANLKKLFPQSAKIGEANENIARIRSEDVLINNAGVQLAAAPAKLQLAHRNVSKVWFVARTIDVKGFLEELRNEKIDDAKGLRGQWALSGWHRYFASAPHLNEYEKWIYQIAAKYVGGEVARWADEVKDDGTHRITETFLQTPLKDRGAYLIYAYLKEPAADEAQKSGLALLQIGQSRAAFVLTDLALVDKKTEKGNLYFVSDARSGAPVSEAKVDVLHVWNTWDQKGQRTVYHKEMYNLTTDKDGFALLPFPKDRQYGQLHVLVSGGAGRIAWSGMSYWNSYGRSGMRDGVFAYVITDRPVYRPDQTVRFKVWLRHMLNGNLENMPSASVGIDIYDVRGNKVLSTTKQADQFGGVDGEYALPSEPPLGVYRIQVRHPRLAYVGGENFRVEEYKKPEFEVTVEPSKSHTKLGDKVTALVKAAYYFGGPVADATVTYKVFREEYTHSYYFPGQWDWLYGPGYGWSWYEYPWFPWWREVRSCWAPPYWWWGYWGRTAPNPVRELVMQGEGPIGAEGTLKVEIDTAPAARSHPDRDHQYVVEAEVRDASRRVITGLGRVKVTRQAYYAFVQSDRGYYRPGEEMLVRVRCLTPDNKPVKTGGLVTVSSVIFGGPDNARIEETELERFKVETDADGLVEFRRRYEKSGQLKIVFEAPDAWGGTVKGYGLVWVCGRDFDGQLYKFNNLELITDKRTYQPGETAHVMLATQHSNAYVLLSDNVDNNCLLSWKLVSVPNRVTTLDLPITKERQPNFFIEATTVADGRVHQQSSRILVPPEEGMLKVTVATDKPTYKPGEKATVTVTARTLDGKPAQAQVALSVFDKSVLYIQPEYTPEIARFFHGRVRTHSMQMGTNLVEQLSAYGRLHRPFQQLGTLPPAWWGIWGPTVQDWRTIGDEQLGQMGGGRGGAGPPEGPNQALAADLPALAGASRSRSAKASADRSADGVDADKAAEGGAGAFAETEVRQKFADTALWLPSLTTDADGAATATLDMPENLTTWKVNAWGMTAAAKVGQADATAITTKKLLVRLQAPRFFMELDEVVVSANVMNYLTQDQTARVSLDLPKDLLQLIGATKETVDIKVAAQGSARVDWRVKVLKEGVAKLTVKALTTAESDAMAMTFPVLVHGMTKQVATTGSMRPADLKKSVTVELTVPDKRRPELTRLEVQYSPSLVGAMLDALPYLINYPYGCTEQTMSRFVPCVLTLKTLQNMGIKLEDVQKIRGRLEEVRRIEKGEHLSVYWMNPVFDSAELDKMIKQSLTRIQNMQHGDGGWGWWTSDASSSYMTAYVLWALCTARDCDLAIDQNIIQRGMQYLKNWEEGEMRKKGWEVSHYDAYVAYVLSMNKVRAAIQPDKDDQRPGDLLDRLHDGRDKLGLYAKAHLALALANLGDLDRARLVLQNILQYKEENAETEVAWFRTPQAGWWHWWNNDIESNAMVLKALVKLDPKSDVAPRLVKWLLNNRRNGYYWRSTRDTTLCLAAMSDFVKASGEGQPDYTLTLDFDRGASVKTVKINKDNFFTFDNKFLLEGVTIGGGKHTLTITKDGPGALYFNTYLRYFTQEEHITAAGLELKVDRTYFKLVQFPFTVDVEDSTGKIIREKRLRYERVPVKDGDTVKSGDVIQVELKVTSDNDYTYLCFEDMKPAGCEPTEVRSGGKGQEGFYSYMELRDEKTVFFVGAIGQGEHLLRYRLRAEVPGVFHALPSVLYGMYVPELRANSDECVIKIVD
jgi:uncharacterized protein YfaS (alpha-2-macroglobulin family)